MRKYLLALVGVVLAFASCSDELEIYDNGFEQSPTTVNLQLSAEDIDNPSRSMNENIIKDVNIFLYGDNMNYHFYFSSPQSKLEFEALPNTYRVYVVANAHANIGDITEQQVREYQLDSSTMLHNEDIPMSSQTTISIPPREGVFTTPGIKVKRIAARVSFDIKIAAELSFSIKIRSVQFCNIPRNGALFSSGEPSSDQSADYYDGEVFETPAFSYSKVVYMLENRQGTVATITNQKDKCRENAPICATYMRIVAQGQSGVLEYIVYLGANNTSDFNVDRNNRYTINLTIKGENEIDNRMKVYEGLYYGSANSIICTNGQVSFDAAPYRTSKSIAYGYTNMLAGYEYEAVRASVLWQDVRGLVTKVKYYNNRVTVTTNGGRGNAVVAIYDSENTVLWSFHVWCTETPRNCEYAPNSLGRAYVVMDRNLGATTTTVASHTSYGLLYQWGRKDPFVGSMNATTNTDGRMYSYSGGEVKLEVQYATPEISVESVRATPKTFYYGNSNWFGDVSKNEFLWGDSGIENPQKSVYDPCPEGYKVGKNDWMLVTSINGKLNAGSSSDLSTGNYYTYSIFNLGWRLYYDNKGTNSSKVSYFPAAGIRDGYSSGKGVLKSVGVQANYWSSTWRSSSRAYITYLNASTVAISASHSPTMGMRVRCVKSPEITELTDVINNQNIK